MSEKPIKIAIFTQSIEKGAFLNVTAGLSHAFSSALEAEIDIVHVKKLNSEVENTFMKGVCFHCLQASKTYKAIPKLRQYLIDENPDVLISMPSYVNIIAIIAKLITPKWKGKLIITEHANMTTKAYIEHKGEFVMGNMPFYAKLFYRYAHAIVAVGHGALSDLKENVKINMPNMRVIANPINLKMVTERANSANDAQRHPWLVDKRSHFCFVSVGRLEKQKDMPTLVNAFAMFIKKRKAKLIIVGEGSLHSQIDELIRSHHAENFIQLVGYQDNPYSYIIAADAFVLSSEEEAFGLVVVEALTLGKPVVSVDAFGGGPREILEGGKSGLLVERKSPYALCEALCEVIDNPDLRRDLTKAALNRAPCYAPHEIGKKWNKLFIELGVGE